MTDIIVVIANLLYFDGIIANNKIFLDFIMISRRENFHYINLAIQPIISYCWRAATDIADKADSCLADIGGHVA